MLLVASGIFSPDPAGDALVRGLGSDRYAERERCQQALVEKRAFGAASAGLASKDPEVRKRCSIVLDRLCSFDVPLNKESGIYHLPDRHRFPLGGYWQAHNNILSAFATPHDAALDYFRRGRVVYHRDCEVWNQSPEQEMRHPTVECIALRLYLRHLAMAGANRDEINDLVLEINLNQRSRTNCYWPVPENKDWRHYRAGPVGEEQNIFFHPLLPQVESLRLKTAVIWPRP